MSQKVLVTGGAGYIGSHAVDLFLQAGHQVWILDNFSTGYRQLVHPSSKLVEGDTRDTALVHQVLKENQIDAVIHFAAFTSVAESMTKPEIYYDNNFGGTLSLLKAIEKTLVKTLVFSSTAAVYADPGQKPVTEASEMNPVTPYGKSKLMSEKAIEDFCKVNGMSAVILRYFNVAGASLSGRWGQVGDEHTSLIKRAALAASGKIGHLEVFGTDYATPDGTAIRDYIHVQDLADLHVEAMTIAKKQGDVQIVNCGYGHGFSVRQVIETMKRVSGVDFKVVEKPRRPGDLGQVISDVQKLRALTSWRPQNDDLEHICRTAYQWELKYRESLGIR